MEPKNIYKTKTYCNPLNIPDCPKGEDFPHVIDFTVFGTRDESI